jgi:glycerol-3-phosphate O-acyltransferase
MRTIAQFLANYRHVRLRAGEPIDVKAFLAAEHAANGGHEAAPTRDGDGVLVRRITYSLLRRLERERKAVLGPAKKPADRLREEVVRSPKLQKIIHDMAGEGAAERRVITWRALAMVREMEAALDMNAVAALDKGLEQVTTRLYKDVEVDEEGIERLRAALKDSTLILLPSHKSHVDYLILAQIFYRQQLPLPLIAAGDNLSFFPLGAVFRRAGAFFIRRSFKGDRLYAAVVDAYIRRLLKDGWPLEFFLEGGRSRTGKLLAPKVGLLSIVVDAVLGVTGKKVYFCPISIGYERLVEEKSFVHEMSGGEKQKEDVKGLLSTAVVLAGRYGRLNVQFGELLTLDDVLQEIDPGTDITKLTPARRRAVVTRLAYRVMNEINRVTAVTPGALVATALLMHDRRGVPHEELIASCRRLAATLHRFGARFTPSLAPRTDDGQILAEALSEAIELFIRAGHVEAHLPGELGSAKARAPHEDAIYAVPPEARLSLDLAKNILVHFFVARALVATGLLAGASPSLPVSVLRERVLALSRLFKHEFQFRADATFDQIFDEEVRAMAADGEVERIGDAVAPAGDKGSAQLALYAGILKNFVEGYRVAARGLAALLKGPLALKDLVKRSIATGERMFLAGEIERREAVSRAVLEAAYASFADQGYVNRIDGKLALPDSYDNATAVKTIETKVAAFLLQ